MSFPVDSVAPSPESRQRILAATAVPTTSIDRLAIARVDARLRQLGAGLVSPDRDGDLADIVVEIEAKRTERDSLRTTPTQVPRVTPEDAIEYRTSHSRLWRMTDTRVGERWRPRRSAVSPSCQTRQVAATAARPSR